MRYSVVACVLLVVFVSVPLIAQQTIYWSKDHIYNGPGGNRVATVTPEPADQSAPAAPSNLVQSNVTSTSVDLSWTASTDTGGSGLAGYKIYRGNLPVGTVTGTSFTDPHLEATTSYTYTVRAFDNAQNHSGPSNAVNLTTLADTLAPEPPLNLTAEIVGNGAQLTWEPAIDNGGSGIAGYKVHRDGIVIDTVSASTLSYTDATIGLDDTYTYTVVAYDNANNESAPSNSAIVSYNGLLTNLVSFWQFDEAVGTRLDRHGSNHLSDNNTVTQAAGKLGNAALFTRANAEYLSIADNADLSTGDIDFTIATWVYLNSKPAGEMSIFSKRAGSPNNEYELYWGNSDRFYLQVSNNGTTLASVSAEEFGPPSTGTWYFIVAWHDSTADEIGIQVNNGTPNTVAHSTGVFDSTSAVQVGAVAGANNWDGRIDHVGFWKRVLTPSERSFLWNDGDGRAYNTITDAIAPTTPSNLNGQNVQDGVQLAWTAATDTGGSGLAGYRVRRDGLVIDNVPASTLSYTDYTVVLNTTYSYTVAAYDHANNESAPSGSINITYNTLKQDLVAFWEVEEASGTRSDQHGANHLSDNNTVTQAVGKVGNAAHFARGSSEYLSIADNPGLSTGDIDFTIAAWVYLDSKPAGEMSVISRRDPSPQFEYEINWTGSATDKFRFYVSPDGSSLPYVEATNLGATSTGAWYFIVAWHDSVNNEIAIQVNDGTPNTASHSTGVIDSTSATQLGAVQGVNNWDGRIDQIGFWKRVLTANERSFLYNAGSGRAYSEF